MDIVNMVACRMSKYSEVAGSIPALGPQNFIVGFYDFSSRAK